MSSLAGGVGKTCCVGKKTFHTPLTAGCEVFLLKSCNQVPEPISMLYKYRF
jgi:hypothetical protein